MKKISKEIIETKVLFAELPAFTTALFILSVVLMNFLAAKEINFGNELIVVDCGLAFSWLSFLCMDMYTRQFGAKATIKLSIFALIVNLCVSFIFTAVSFIPGNWSQFYEFLNPDINTAINNTLKSSWYVVFGSSVAFLCSSIINALLNQAIGRLFKNHSFIEYITRSYISTFIAQIIDNFIFAWIVSHYFFGWTIIQCVSCAFISCLFELVLEVIFSPIGYFVCEKWRKSKLGKKYKKVLKNI